MKDTAQSYCGAKIVWHMKTRFLKIMLGVGASHHWEKIVSAFHLFV